MKYESRVKSQESEVREQLKLQATNYKLRNSLRLAACGLRLVASCSLEEL